MWPFITCGRSLSVMISLHSKPDLGKGNTTFTLVSRKFFYVTKGISKYIVDYYCQTVSCVVCKISFMIHNAKTKLENESKLQ